MKKVEDGYKLKLSMVVNLLGLPENARKLAEALGDIVDDDELNARSTEFDEFVDKLLDPQDKHLRLPGEDILFDAHITQLLKAIKAGTRGTAVQRLVDNTTVENQAEGAVQGGRAAPNPKFQPNNALREQLKSISQMARKRKRSDTVEAELEEDRGRDDLPVPPPLDEDDEIAGAALPLDGTQHPRWHNTAVDVLLASAPKTPVTPPPPTTRRVMRSMAAQDLDKLRVLARTTCSSCVTPTAHCLATSLS
ncbi:uncharacterized protein B0H18DRAFT_1126619 [Fomitopsis serialis]|uniref:uncharacterized protein n=1 Tax=Fomitopsis serialis TaxID=139415 RepID=UPI00200784E8|nr:uncharacterized protein B0H18DRAFT_1126619 [Neoantrodia serialis]KAH9913042.1 hypothetical protein B0H18DRAFT_1126619 [Neoantrodia serialis]